MPKPELCICFLFWKQYFDNNTMDDALCMSSVAMINNHSRPCEEATYVQRLHNCWNCTDLRIAFRWIFSQGYSSLAVALALPESGLLVACERDERCLEVAKRYYRLAGVAHKVIVFSTLLCEIIWPNKLTTWFSMFLVYFLILTSLAIIFQ